MNNISSKFGSPNYRGRGYQGGGRRGGGRGGRGFQGRGFQDGNVQGGRGNQGERPKVAICSFDLTGECTRGASCRNQHGVISVFQCPLPNNPPVKCLELLNSSQGPMLLSGASDKSVKAFLIPNNLSLSSNINNAGSGSSIGSVQRIQVKDGTLMWAVDEPVFYDEVADMAPLLKYNPDINVGIVYLVDSNNMNSKLPLHISPDRPYTHIKQVRAFVVEKIQDQIFAMTGGGEGIIRTWKFDQATSRFQVMSTLEGHLRDITALWFDGNHHLWSGSTDKSIRVWDVNTNSCIATFSLTATETVKGHSDVVTCFEFIPHESDRLLASGGGDGNVIIWNADSGDYLHTCSHGNVLISSMKAILDASSNHILIVAVTNGKLFLRDCRDMSLVCMLESRCQQSFVWGILDLAHANLNNNFVTAGDDGKIIVWTIQQPLLS